MSNAPVRLLDQRQVTLPTGLVLNSEDSAGVVWHLEDLEGWDPTGSTGEVTQRAYQSGGWVSRAFHTARTLAIQAVIVAPTPAALIDAKDRLAAAIPLDDLDELRVDEAGAARSVWIRQDGDPIHKDINPRATRVSLQLVAPDYRRLRSGAASSLTTGLPSSSGGLGIPPSVEVRRNLCVDPRLTSGTTSATRWYGTGGSGVSTWGNAGGPDGRTFGRKTWSVVPTGTADVGFQGNTSYKTVVTPGVPVFVSAKVRCNNAVGTFSVGAQFYDAAGATLGSTVYSTATATDITLSPTWQTVSGWVTPPGNAASMIYIISNWRAGVGGISAGTTLDCADVVVATLATDFFDGSFSPDSDLTASWTGAANASPSVLYTRGGFAVPFSIDATTVTGVLSIVNAGNAPAPAVVRIDGPAQRPVIRHEEQGLELLFDLILDAGQWLEVDLDKHTVMLNGQASRRGLMRGRWPAIVPGTNTISWSSLTADPSAAMTVSWRDAWK